MDARTVANSVLQSTGPTIKDRLVDLPSPYARVPPDKMMDTPYYVLDPPAVGPPLHMPSVQETAEAPIQKQIDDMFMPLARAALNDPAKYDEMSKLRDALMAQTGPGRFNLRGREVQDNATMDAQVMQDAIERRQRLGRKEQ